jgi:23S rRNA-/tRNA-specific pseudouridylate synthase
MVLGYYDTQKVLYGLYGREYYIDRIMTEAEAYELLVKHLLPDGTSLVACRIEHGRTHQIRVHMSLTGHPIVGDRMYGPEAEDGSAVQEIIAGEDICPLMLHAYRAGFRQPFTGEPVRIEAALPEWAMDIKAQC